ncbi:hypothetical protein PoB_002516100 [Plakobranchus ocellatus]|uniref:Uncharacterized protein n=1 Tax=Plakobranchus ocellatus TaxID=259542 RepID=A0AAV3ZRQ9_9GAST|nr:hypothetical protein PoB_002516100 [Plakobranchus ocellatus]
MHSSLSCRVIKLKWKMARPNSYTNSGGDSDYNPDETVDALDDSVHIRQRRKKARLSLESLTSISYRITYRCHPTINNICCPRGTDPC